MEPRGKTVEFWRRGSSVQPAALRLAELRWPNPLRNTAEAKNTKRRQLLGRTLEGLAVSPKDAFRLLLQWDDRLFNAAGIQVGEEMRYWIKAAQFTQELLLREPLLHQLNSQQRPEQGDGPGKKH
ncbi:hypothetical protein P9222_02125 [Paenibacillus amylolyticus]|nr:hypothetical protein [Paenibacillus amylolyticus]WFR63233.1 hypothetical protein P9222_02125 [Paenibacillus amylolyticus]